MVSVFKKVVLWFINFYISNISPFYPSRCRFYPTCSQYFVEAIEIFGLIKGLKLGLFRILRCNCFCKGGFDPVLKNFSKDEEV